MKTKTPTLDEETKSIMEMLLKRAKDTRAKFKYSEDEKMMPMAIINGDEVTIMGLAWKDEDEKYAMAAAANARARATHATSLSFVTDARWVKAATFCEYFRLDPPDKTNVDMFSRHYHRILAAHGGQVKNLPRQVWEEAVVVFTNGPGIPLTIQMAPYREGPNDTIEWLPSDEPRHGETGRSDMLTDWWS